MNYGGGQPVQLTLNFNYSLYWLNDVFSWSLPCLVNYSPKVIIYFHSDPEWAGKRLRTFDKDAEVRVIIGESNIEQHDTDGFTLGSSLIRDTDLSTETTDTSHSNDFENWPISIGHEVANVPMKIVDPVTPDVVRNGEQARDLLIAGDGVSEGCVKNPQETERRYFSDRYGQSAGMVSFVQIVFRIFSLDSTSKWRSMSVVLNYQRSNMYFRHIRMFNLLLLTSDRCNHLKETFVDVSVNDWRTPSCHCFSFQSIRYRSRQARQLHMAFRSGEAGDYALAIVGGVWIHSPFGLGSNTLTGLINTRPCPSSSETGRPRRATLNVLSQGETKRLHFGSNVMILKK